jgi:hypothetical protein
MTSLLTRAATSIRFARMVPTPQKMKTATMMT